MKSTLTIAGNHPTTYALSYIRRLDLANLYQQGKKRLETEIQKLTQLAETKRENQKVLTLQYCFQTLPLFERLTEAETILLPASATYPLVDQVFQEPESGQPLPSKSEISD